MNLSHCPEQNYLNYFRNITPWCPGGLLKGKTTIRKSVRVTSAELEERVGDAFDRLGWWQDSLSC